MFLSTAFFQGSSLLRQLTLLFAVALLSACAAVPRPASVPVAGVAGASHPGALPDDAWARVLEQFVDPEGRVNFAALANNRTDLDRVTASVYDTGPNNQPQLFASREVVLAFHLNAYNALAMYQVIESGIPVSLAGFNKVRFFYFGKLQVGGTPISLYDYENEVIRALSEPRIHFALNCMSVGCPRLPREPFRAATLEQQLEREAWRFFNDPRHIVVEPTRGVVRLSEILRFYPEDFLKVAPSLIAYVNRYRDIKVPDSYAIEYIPYDWTVNRQPR